MKSEEVIAELENVAEDLGIEVRYNRRLEGMGGLCRVYGERKIILKSTLEDRETIERLVTILKEEDIDSIYIPPAIRSLFNPGK